MITIVIPSYNQAQFLPEAIESALRQKVGVRQIIVVDDGSTDNSLEVAKSFTNSKVKVISQVNKGLASARNTGIMNSQDVEGDYILPLDADDILHKECVKRILERAILTQADVIAPSFKTFGTTNTEVILMPYPKIEDFKTGNRIGYCSAVKRKVLLEVGGYSPKMVYGYEDLHLWYNLLSRGKTIATIPEVLWMYRTKENSMIHEAQSHHQELMDQIKKDFNDSNT